MNPGRVAKKNKTRAVSSALLLPWGNYPRSPHKGDSGWARTERPVENFDPERRVIQTLIDSQTNHIKKC